MRTLIELSLRRYNHGLVPRENPFGAAVKQVACDGCEVKVR
jgi:hypothetical protein